MPILKHIHLSEEDYGNADDSRKPSSSEFLPLSSSSSLTSPKKSFRKGKKGEKNKRKRHSLHYSATTTPFFRKVIFYNRISIPIQEQMIPRIPQSRSLLSYNPVLGGVLLAYSKEQSVKQSRDGEILLSPCKNPNIMMECLVFAPCQGMEMNGRVSESFPSHLGILVFSHFSVVVPGRSLHDAGYAFDPKSCQWQRNIGGENGSDQKNHHLCIAANDIVRFVVKMVNECDGIISMEGRVVV